MAKGDLFRKMYFALIKEGYSKEEASKMVKEAMEKVIKGKKREAAKSKGFLDILKEVR